MATVGTVSSEGAVNAGWAFSGPNANTQAWSTVTMPTPGGWITKLHCYYDTNSGTATTDIVLWDSGGNVLATVAIASTPAGSHSAGGQAWHSGVLSTPVYVQGGATISIGFWCPGANGILFSSISGGSSTWNGVGFSAPGAQSAPTGSTGIGNLGMFGEFVPNKLKVRRSGAWVEAPLRVRRSGVWVPATPLWVRRSGAWVQVQ